MVRYVRLKWHDERGKECLDHLGKRDDYTAAQLRTCKREKELSLNNGEVKASRKRTTFGALRDLYADQRRQGVTGRGYRRGVPRLGEKTITDHMMTIRYLVQHFGETKAIDSIRPHEADAFFEALAAGELVDARKEAARDYGTTDQTVRKHVRNAKAIYNWALALGRATHNPFADFTGAPGSSKENHYAPLSDFEKLIAALDRLTEARRRENRDRAGRGERALSLRALQGDRVLIALCRLAGLRRCEALSLPWSGRMTDSDGAEHPVGVDWQRKRLRLVGNHKGQRGRKYREVPICPRLEQILTEWFQAGPEGAATVWGVTENNLHRRAETYCTVAGVAKWPEFFQAMRSSCENDWKTEGFAEPTYCAWTGHSPAVSRKHYVAPTDSEFDAAIGAGGLHQR